MPLDLTRYTECKEKKSVTLQRLGPKKYQAIVTKFDQFSKEQVDSDVQEFTRDSIEASIKNIDEQIANLQKAKSGLTVLTTDINELDALSTAPKPS